MLNTGKITQIIGPVVDVRFPEGEVPSIYTALAVKNEVIKTMLKQEMHAEWLSPE